MEKDYIPHNLEEAFEWIDKYVVDIKDFIKCDEDEAIGMSHHGLGRWLRNNWGLWKEDSPMAFYFMTLGIKHADDMSGIILTSYWRHKNNKPLELDKQVQHYKDWWSKEGNPFKKEDEGIG